MICKTCKRELHQDWVCCPWCSTKNKAEAGTDKTRVYRFYAEQLKQSWGELAPNTVRGYQSPFRRCVDHFGDLPVGGITPAMIKAFLDSLGKTFCKKTVITHRQLISQTMALAILGGDITFNPTDAKYRTAGRPSAQREDPLLAEGRLPLCFGRLFCWRGEQDKPVKSRRFFACRAHFRTLKRTAPQHCPF